MSPCRASNTIYRKRRPHCEAYSCIHCGCSPRAPRDTGTAAAHGELPPAPLSRPAATSTRLLPPHRALFTPRRPPRATAPPWRCCGSRLPSCAPCSRRGWWTPTRRRRWRSPSSGAFGGWRRAGQSASRAGTVLSGKSAGLTKPERGYSAPSAPPVLKRRSRSL